MDRFIKVDNYLPIEQWNNLLNFFEKKVQWSYGWPSNATKSSLAHLNYDFLGTHRLNQSDHQQTLASNPALKQINDIWLKLKNEYLPQHALVRCYANAHVYGIEGDIHVDSDKPGNYTSIFYIVPEWKPDWAGETILLNDLGDIAHAVIPKPNRMMIFDGRIQHAARAVHRKYTGLRVTLMFKSREQGAGDE